MCGIESKNTKENENGFLVPVESYNQWRDCTPGCRSNECHNCEDSNNYVEPTDIAKLTELGYIDDASKEIKVLLNLCQVILNKKWTMLKKCYQKSMNECQDSRDCFYCVSSQPKNVRNCTAIGANGDYICDSQFSSACVPLLTRVLN